jgi:hypothetical protein
MNKLILVIKVADNINPESIVEDINMIALCKLEEDDKSITGWEWIY